MTTLRAYLGVPDLTDVGYRLYNRNTALAARSTTDILDEGDGWYSAGSADLTLVGLDHVRWDGDFDPDPPNLPRATARETLTEQIRIESYLDAAVSSRSAHSAADVWAYATRTLTALPDPAPSGYGAGTPGGTGAFVVSVTVTDGTSPLQNANVRLTEGVNNFSATTDASGVASFALDAATYGLAITKDGYQFAPVAVAVSAAADFPATMTLIITPVPPATAAQSVGSVATRDAVGNAQAGVVLLFQMTRSATGNSFSSHQFSVTSDINGLAQGVFARGATYTGKRGRDGAEIAFTVPDAASFDLPALLGMP